MIFERDDSDDGREVDGRDMDPSTAAAAAHAADLAGAGFVARLEHWAAEARADEAARARAREHWMRRQAAEETSFAGVLADLADRRRPVLVHASTGRRHRGWIVALGVDFAALRTDTGHEVLLRTSAITAVRTQPREADAASGRHVVVRVEFATAVVALAADRPRVLVATAAEPLAGELRSVGTDVLTLRLDGAPPSTVYVPLASVLAIEAV